MSDGLRMFVVTMLIPLVWLIIQDSIAPMLEKQINKILPPSVVTFLTKRR